MHFSTKSVYVYLLVPDEANVDDKSFPSAFAEEKRASPPCSVKEFSPEVAVELIACVQTSPLPQIELTNPS